MPDLDFIRNAVILLVGLCLIACGFWGSTNHRPLLATVMAWCAPIGLVISLAGLVLLLIPDFFTG